MILLFKFVSNRPETVRTCFLELGKFTAMIVAIHKLYV